MSNVMPKVKSFIFISMICLLINLSICCVSMASESVKLNEYTQSTDQNIQTSTAKPQNSISANNFIIATGTSFLPFVDLVNLVFIKDSLDIITLLIFGLIIGMLGALKLFLLAVMIANFFPTINV